MPAQYASQSLQQLFQSPFDIAEWTMLLRDLFRARNLHATPLPIDSSQEGYYLGDIDSQADRVIGLFYYKVRHGSVAHRPAGLRSLVNSYVNSRWAQFYAVLAVFDDGQRWRLSLVSDIRDSESYTSPRRHTFLFGEPGSGYHTAVSRFLRLQSRGISPDTISEAFSVEALTKEFYTDLYAWYDWAISSADIYFPSDTDTETSHLEDRDTKIIRLLTRLIFVWFIKQKGLVPEELFSETHLRAMLKDFDPQSATQGSYYNAILQNLFFATLNCAADDPHEGRRGFAHRPNQRDVKTLYRYAELFSISQEEVLRQFAPIPFLNGGLFECLDKTRRIDGVERPYSYDGFSRNDARWSHNGRYKYRACIPNLYFFHPTKGLLPILRRYNFTVQENTPIDQQVALDPELLGKVFENLLGVYVSETKETARKQSGSFYTPREIVNYMIDESLLAYLTTQTPATRQELEDILSDAFTPQPGKEDLYKQVAQRLRQVKIFDPACGSGAFPVGLLNRMVDILQKIDPHESPYQLKLSIIENCIYGADIQNIAVQITKLRFFIALICDCEPDPARPNFGIPTLPNLETKFVAANTLIALHEPEGLYTTHLENPLLILKDQLLAVRHSHFRATTAPEKERLRIQDQHLRAQLHQHLLTMHKEEIGVNAMQLAGWNPYDQNAVSPFFDHKWMFGLSEEFDIVIGNPPYIQLQKNGGQLARLYQDKGYKTFARTGDIYCLFYERAHQLLKEGGHLCFITSNKWMRAGYGEKLRAFLAKNTDPKLLVDFAGVQIFENATVDTNILLFERGSTNRGATLCVAADRDVRGGVGNLSHYARQRQAPCPLSGAGPWAALSPAQQRLRRRVELMGTPLKQWGVNIYRGVLTGCNDAFIIPTARRDEILAACRSEEERQRTAELIRPILRGRDIRPYGHAWAGLYLIATFPSRKYDIEQYPAIRQHLLSFGMERLEQTGKTHLVGGEEVKARKKSGNQWFEVQDSISYWEEFDRPKIVYSEIVRNPQFFLDAQGDFYAEATAFILTGEHLEHLYQILNSRVFTYIFKSFYAGGGLGESGYRYKKLFLEKVPIPKRVAGMSTQLEALPGGLSNIDRELMDLYEFSEDERLFIESQCIQ